MEENQVPEVVDEKLQEVRQNMIGELMSAYEVPRGKAAKAVDSAIEAGYPIKQYAETHDDFIKAVDAILERWVD